MKSVEDLDVFKLAHQLALKIYSTTKSFPGQRLSVSWKDSSLVMPSDINGPLKLAVQLPNRVKFGSLRILCFEINRLA